MKSQRNNKYNNTMGIYILKRRVFSKYDDTDALKRMKDSDILAEKPKGPETKGSHIAAATGAGIIGGAAIGGLGKAAFGKRAALQSTGFRKAGEAMRNTAGRFGRGAKAGAIIGGSIMAIGALSKRSKEKANNEFYNDRLRYAQRQAVRREKADWKTNMTQREGYSY